MSDKNGSNSSSNSNQGTTVSSVISDIKPSSDSMMKSVTKGFSVEKDNSPHKK